MHALKLHAGDLLMLENLRMHNGRIPYTDSIDGQYTMLNLLYERVVRVTAGGMWMTYA